MATLKSGIEITNKSYKLSAITWPSNFSAGNRVRSRTIFHFSRSLK